MEQTVWKTMKRHSLIAGGDSVIVALSGGADSMALFYFLFSNREKLGIQLSCAHFEHGLRGEESLRDAEFVKEMCARLQVPLHMACGEMGRRARPRGLGVEAWARRLRYRFFDDLAVKQSAKIALAHTMSDQAETVLFRAIRGSGPRGIASMAPQRGHYIRPLLEVTRTQVEQYCAGNALEYVRDTTNLDEGYSRNRIRLLAMPQLRQAHPGAVQSLARLAEDMRQIDSYLWEEGKRLLLAAGGAEAADPDARGIFSAGGFSTAGLRSAAPPVRRQALAALAGSGATRQVLARMDAVLEGTLGAVQIPGGKVAHIKKGRFYVEEIQAVPAQQESRYPLAPGQYSFADGFDIEVRFCSADNFMPAAKKINDNRLTFSADYDKIIPHSEFRTRRAKDKYRPPGRVGTKPLKKWMNERGIPPARRPLLPLLACENQVYWVWDEGFCDAVCPDAQTSRLLVILQGQGGA